MAMREKIEELIKLVRSLRCRGELTGLAGEVLHAKLQELQKGIEAHELQLMADESDRMEAGEYQMAFMDEGGKK